VTSASIGISDSNLYASMNERIDSTKSDWNSYASTNERVDYLASSDSNT
jgi:hypothetical protein